MAKRFGRNQRRKLLEELCTARSEASKAQLRAFDAENKLDESLRDQLRKGKVPLEVEHFLSPDRRNIVMHTIYDERRSNLHYQYQISPKELELQRDKKEREQFAMYLGRAIADRLADSYAGMIEGTSKAA
jgi:hypothetical protein